MEEMAIVIFLGINSWLDIRKKQISLWMTGIFAAAGIWYGVKGGHMNWASLGVGAAFLLGSLVVKGAVGMGDGWVLVSLGIVLEFWEFMVMLSIASVLAALWGMMLMVVFQKKKDTEMPFLPFLLLGYVGGLCL